jgi:8-oxo-dGTP diphosphatase
VLIAQRPKGWHQGGLWEFPGGKVEPGEDGCAALQRELREELGIEITIARPLIRVRHRYADRAVLLDCWSPLDTEAGSRERPEARPTPYVRGDTVGRNSPCPCGSGKKYPSSGKSVGELWFR